MQEILCVQGWASPANVSTLFFVSSVPFQPPPDSKVTTLVLILPCFPLSVSTSFLSFARTYVVCASTNRATKTALWRQFAPCLWVSFFHFHAMASLLFLYFISKSIAISWIQIFLSPSDPWRMLLLLFATTCISEKKCIK